MIFRRIPTRWSQQDHWNVLLNVMEWPEPMLKLGLQKVPSGPKNWEAGGFLEAENCLIEKLTCQTQFPKSGNLPLIQPNHVRTWASLKAVSGPTLCTIFQSPLHSWRFLETRMLIEMTLASGIPADEDSRLRAREVGRDWAITVGCDSCNRWESWEQFWWTKLCHFLWTLL